MCDIWFVENNLAGKRGEKEEEEGEQYPRVLLFIGIITLQL